MWEAYSENVVGVKVQQYGKDKEEQTVSSLGLKFKSLGGTTPDTEHWLKEVKPTKWNRQAGRFDLSSYHPSPLKPNTQATLNTLILSEKAKLSFPCLLAHAATSTWKVHNCPTPPHPPHSQESVFTESLA